MTDSRPGLQFQEIWASAITRYNQDTKRDYLERGLVADSPDALFGILDKGLNRFKQYRKRGERVRHTIRSVLELVNISSGAIGDSLATAFPPVKAVYVAVCVLLKAAKDVSGHYDMIIDMFEKLKGFMGRLEVYVQHKITDNLKKIIVGILAQVLVVLGVATKWMNQRRLVQYWKVLFKKNTEVSDAMGTLQILSGQEVPMVTAVILATTTTTSQNVQASEDGALRDKIRLWLKPPDPTTNYNTAVEARQVGTGAWLIQSQDFVDWMTTRGSFMWICGIPGNGKTIICSTAIEALQCQSDSSVGLAYFYFYFNDSEKLIYRNMLHSLVFQLLKRCPGPLRDLYDRTDNGSRQPTVSELLDVLNKTVCSLRHTYIVLDGLDECGGAELTALLKFLAKAKSWNLENLHILATSRPEQEIKEAMAPLYTCLVDLHGVDSRINDDIDVYLKEFLQDDPRLNKWGIREQWLIQNIIAKRAGGMFQWVRCQLDSLRHCVTTNDLETALKTLPKSLDETYERILRNIPDDHSEKIHRILQFLCFSRRPMMLGELAEVVAVAINSEGEARYDSGNHMRDPSEVLTICGSLVSLSSRSGAADGLRFEPWHPVFPNDMLAARLIRVSHFSVKEFLFSERIRTGQASFYSLNARLAHRLITMTCLAYLMRFDTDGLDENKMKQDKDVALASYASHYWVSHFRQQGLDAHQPLRKLVQDFFHLSRRKYFLNWTRMYNLDRPWNSPNWHRAAHIIPDPLYHSCMVGLLDVSKWLLTEGAEVNAQGGWFGNALQAASRCGHEPIVQLLLDQGAEIDAQGGYLGTALQAASCGGHESIVQLLLDRSAEVNALGGHFGTALQAASRGGHESIVRLLLRRSAEINAQGGFLGTALQAASDGGHGTIVRLLLDRGAEVNSEGGLYEYALSAASAGGRIDIVQLLLDRGAEINAEGNRARALQYASYRGHIIIVRLLLDRGAEINANSKIYGTAMQAASIGGHEFIVRLLLDRGADINAQGGLFGGALQAASAGGYEGIVRLLLDRGVEVNRQGVPLQSALRAALTPRSERHYLFGPRRSSKWVARILWNIGARLYAMPAGAHSEEYIARLRDMDEINLKGNSDTRSSRRRSWS